MKSTTDFWLGFLGPEAIATKPIGNMKYMDWKKVREIVNENPSAVIRAGLREDWDNTSGLIFAHGKYYDGGIVYGCSVWATPIVDVDGMEIECYVTEEPDGFTRGLPEWWGNGEQVHSEWDFYDCEVDGYDDPDLDDFEW